MISWRPITLSASLVLPARAGQRRKPLVELLAVEYLLTPQPRPHGLQKQLAHSNGISPNKLCHAIRAIAGAKRRGKRT